MTIAGKPAESYIISRFDISASGIGFDLNTRLLRPGLVESICRVHMRSEWPMAIVGFWSFSCRTLYNIMDRFWPDLVRLLTQQVESAYT